MPSAAPVRFAQAGGALIAVLPDLKPAATLEKPAPPILFM